MKGVVVTVEMIVKTLREKQVIVLNGVGEQQDLIGRGKVMYGTGLAKGYGLSLQIALYVCCCVVLMIKARILFI